MRIRSNVIWQFLPQMPQIAFSEFTAIVDFVIGLRSHFLLMGTVSDVLQYLFTELRLWFKYWHRNFSFFCKNGFFAYFSQILKNTIFAHNLQFFHKSTKIIILINRKPQK